MYVRAVFCKTQGLQGGLGMKGEKGIPGFPGARVSMCDIYNKFQIILFAVCCQNKESSLAYWCCFLC